LVPITSGDELADILNKALQIEMEFESSSIWEGYIEIKTDEMRDLLFTLSSESHEHAQMLERMMKMVITESGRRSPPLQERRFNFANMEDAEIMRQLLKFDRLALDLYSGIRDSISEDGTGGIISDEGLEEFTSMIDHLIEDEKRHVEMLNSLVGNIERIR
jgi:hypothetical protein